MVSLMDRSCSGSKEIKSISFEKWAMALTVKLQQLFPNLLEDIMMKLVPRLEAVKMQNFGSILL